LEVGRRAPELLDTFHVVEGWVDWELGDGQGIHHADALNIVIERLENQPYLDKVLP